MSDLTKSLPQDILNYIFEFVQNMDKIFVNKTLYKKYHYLIKNKVNKFRYEKYIRFTIRQNMTFPFEHVINENYRRWIHMKRYRYKDMEFSNYVEFLKFYCNENNSNRCLEILTRFLNTKPKKFIQAFSVYCGSKEQDDNDNSRCKIKRNIVYKNYYNL